MERGQKNGAGALQWVQQAEFLTREPDLNALAAVWSPESGVVDAETFVQTLRLQAERAEVAIGWCTELVDLSQDSQGWSLRLRAADGNESSLHASVVVNAAGLHADDLALRAGYDIDGLGWRQRLVRGDYYSLQGSTPRPRCALVYPVPEPSLEGLGVHLTRDLGGRWLAGPDTTDIDEIDYRVGSNKAEAFAASLRAWLPEISASELRADYAGIRPRLVGPANASRDFVISLESEGFLHLGGIESPGLTASLAIGAHAAQMVEASGLMS
jgi:D-amino-acid oxidase